MIRKNFKNYLIFIKNYLKNIKKKNIKSNIQENNSIELKKIIKNRIFEKKVKTNKSSQLDMYKQNIKSKIFINRWELYNLYTNNELPNFKKKFK
jgi:hypothetical protein